MAAVDLGSLLNNPRCRVKAIGIELEGGWTALPAGVNGLHPDGSVSFEELAQGQHMMPDGSIRRNTRDMRPPYIGELPSPILSMAEWKDWLRSHYPSHVNGRCGMHVHMSFRDLLRYQRLMTADNSFSDTVVNEIRKWATEQGGQTIPPYHPLWERCLGSHIYCRNIFQGDEQVLSPTKNYNHHASGNRYTAIHYCFRLHTIECRLLPMFEKVETSISAIQKLLDITSAFLVTVTKRESPIIGSFSLTQPLYQEEQIECV